MIGGIIIATAAVVSYYDTATRDQKKPFREAQLTLCRDASDMVATLASFSPRAASNPACPTDKIEDPWQVAWIRFEQLYWGSLAIVENGAVEGKMVVFRDLLMSSDRDIRAGTLAGNKRRDLQRAALDISHECRALLSQSWRMELPILHAKETGLPPAPAKVSK
jgi:hypothetical protein